MKNSITALFFLIPFLISAQTGTGTTLEEYRFLSKGYAYQKSMGLDASKEGYDVRAIGPEMKEVSFVGLYRKGVNHPQAVLLILNADAIKPEYICLPNNQADQRVMELFAIDQAAMVDPKTKALYSQALRQLTFYMLGDRQTPLASNSIVDQAVVERKLPGTSPTPTRRYEVAQTTTEPKSYEFTPKSAPQTEVNTHRSSDNNTSAETQMTNKEAINTGVAIEMDEAMVSRGVLTAPVVTGTYSDKGKVAVKFCVDKNGNVTFAKFTQMGSTTFSKTLAQQAVDSIKKAAFAKNEEEKQCGKAVFYFR